MSSPLFSIIIPTYNRAYCIGKALQFVLDQSYPEFEVIVVDDGSTDDTEQVVRSFQDPRLHYYKIPNSERGYARNYGAARSEGRYLCFHDSDDILYTHHLETAAEIIRKNSEIPIFHLGYEIITPNKKIKKAGCADINKLLIRGNLLSCNGVFIERKIFDQYRFNEDRRIAGLEDWELWLRLAPHFEIKYFPVITSAVIQHDNRSILQTDKDKLIERVTRFMGYVLSNPAITSYYRGRLHEFKASCYTYIALHVALTKKHRLTALRYFFKGWKEDNFFFLERRFYAILKHLVV